MKKLFIIPVFFITALLFMGAGNLNNGDNNMSDSIYDISVKDMQGNKVDLAEYKGKVLLIVNVASECGYTPQYAGLEKIYEKYNDQGFEILAFPCNDFGGQEPGTNKEITEFCTTNYGVKFKLFDKIKVLGDEKEPLYKRLIDSPSVENGDIKWNFEKFLISRDGKILKRFRSPVEPQSKEITSAIEGALAQK